MDIILDWVHKWEPIHKALMETGTGLPPMDSCTTHPKWRQMHANAHVRHLVYQLCCDSRRVEGVSAPQAARHMVDLSCRWWFARKLNEVRRLDLCWHDWFPSMLAVDEGGGVCDTQPWKDARHVFQSIEAETALRIELRSVIRRAEGTVFQHSIDSPTVPETQPHCATAIALAAALSQQCFIVERSLRAPFIHLTSASQCHQHTSSRIFRQALRSLLDADVGHCSAPLDTRVLERTTSSCLVDFMVNLACNDAVEVLQQHLGASEQSDVRTDAFSYGGMVVALLDELGLSSRLAPLCETVEECCNAVGSRSAAKETPANTGPREILCELLRQLSQFQRNLERVYISTMRNLSHSVKSLACSRQAAARTRFDEGLLTSSSFASWLPQAWKQTMAGAVRTLQQSLGEETCTSTPPMTADVVVPCSQSPPPILSRHGSTLPHGVGDDVAAFLELTALCLRHPSTAAQVRACAAACAEEFLTDAVAASSTHAASSVAVDAVMSSTTTSSSCSATDRRKTLLDLLTVLTILLPASLSSGVSSVEELNKVVGALLSGVRVAVAANSTLVANCLAATLASLLTTENSGTLVSDVLLRLCQVVAHCQCAEPVERALETAFCQRILKLHASGGLAGDATVAIDRMREMVETLSRSLGVSAVARLSAVVRDCSCAANVDWNAVDGHELQMSVLELCHARWGGHVAQDLFRRASDMRSAASAGSLQWSLSRCAAQYETLRQEASDHRRFAGRLYQWDLLSGSVTLCCSFDHGQTVMLQCPPFVVLVVDALQESLGDRAGHFVPLDTVAERCRDIPAAVLKAVLAALANVGVIARQKIVDAFGLLALSSAKQRKIRMESSHFSAAFGRRTSRERSDSVSDLPLAAADRCPKLEAVIVRELKASKVSSHAELRAKCEAQMLGGQPPFSTETFKAALESLLGKEYIRRCTVGDSDGYEYVA